MITVIKSYKLKKLKNRIEYYDKEILKYMKDNNLTNTDWYKKTMGRYDEAIWIYELLTNSKYKTTTRNN